MNKNFYVVVIGSKKDDDGKTLQLAQEFGRLAAENRLTIVTGGGEGLPYNVALACYYANDDSKTQAISPALNIKEHSKHKFPTGGFTSMDFMPGEFAGYDWPSRLKFRNVLLMAKADAVVVISGGAGTMTEFGINDAFGKPVFVFNNSGGFATALPTLQRSIDFKLPITYCETPDKMIQAIVKLRDGQPAQS